jgi:DNA-binding phage protein
MVTENAAPLDDVDDGPDFLEELTEEWTRQDPSFPALTDAAYGRLLLMRKLGQLRREAGLSQTAVAARMGTSQAQLARLEMAESDPRMSTLDRFAIALGYRLEWSLVRSTEPGPGSTGPA